MRKTAEVTINDRGADKTFRITEMPATKLEKWIAKASLLVLSKVNVSNDEENEVNVHRAMADISKRGFGGFNDIPFEQVEPLYDDLLDCVEFKAANIYIKVDPRTIDGQIEDVMTLFKLRLEVLKLNLGFFVTAFPSITQAVAGIFKAKAEESSTQI
jgi:hypothetical protein